MRTVDLDVGWFAADLQNYKQESKMHLLSIHDHVLNFRVDGWSHLLMIAGPVLEKGPATIGLKEDEFRKLRGFVLKAESGWFEPEKIFFYGSKSSLRLSWHRGEKISFAPFKLSALDLKLIEKSANAYRDMLGKSGFPTPSAVLLGLPGGESYFRQKLHHNFPGLVEFLINRRRTDFLSSCAEISGLGRGASPTGDDLIHGVLVAFHYFVFDRHFTESMAEDFLKMAEGTTLMGRHMLETGRRGLTSEALRQFIQALARGKATPTSLYRVLKTGSQTGHDLAAAVLYFVLKYIKSTVLF
ncbi:MAG: DUF2877 domain-containing protein [Bacillota bacterium]